ncbi:MAG: hypothetical protein AAGE94_06050, partial [Acidobacteriota bacterium]
LSTYEGYGLPPLESLAAGTPALVGPGQALDDLWPDYPLRIEPSVESTTTTLQQALSLSSDARRALIDEGRHRLAMLDWRACAERFLAELSIAFGESSRCSPS